ncbi:glycosyltransferase [Xenorhabdus japonica]|uniref:Glycosyl transferase family 2 n=1 Tax=Xenorhabdus japonica TaxID=53341 RepID=A0A1I5E698_9GAMM|nr:glycosyltransferase [Xenorhabdus japonica]SFO07044.1 Glycosyl transferase family 2 [Xenorhabdus japonica]
MYVHLQILISTYGDRINNLKLRPKENITYVIIHQAYEKGDLLKLEELKKRTDINYVQADSVGLTNSRNLALKYFDADIGLITDDDVILDNNIYQTVINAYNRGQYGIKLFKILTSDTHKEFRKYPTHDKKYSRIDLLKACSIEISFSKEVIEKELYFDERFGLGGEFICGEESVFLNHAYKQNIPIEYINKVIAYHPEESTATGMLNNNILEAKGAVYYSVLGNILSVIFILRISFFSKFSKDNGYKKLEVFKGLMNGRRKVLRSNTLL